MLRRREIIEGLTELLLARAALRTHSPAEQLNDVEEAEDLSRRSGDRFSPALSEFPADGDGSESEGQRRSGSHLSGVFGYAFVFAREFQRPLPVLEIVDLSGQAMREPLALAQNDAAGGSGGESGTL